MTPQFQETIEKLMVPEFPGWCTREKAMDITQLVLDTKPELVVEIGVFGGKSLIPMALALRENAKGHAVGIDPWKLAAALEGGIGIENEEWWTKNVDLEDIYAGFVRKVLDLNLTRELSWVRIHSETALALFLDASISIFSCDSNHSEAVSCRDVASWERKVAPGGFWIMDDTNWDSQKKAIELIQIAGFSEYLKRDTYTVYQRP